MLHLDANGISNASPLPPNLDQNQYVEQLNARPEMVYVCQQPGATMGNYDGSFYYAASAGAGELIYIVDTGYNKLNPVNVLRRC